MPIISSDDLYRARKTLELSVKALDTLERGLYTSTSKLITGSKNNLRIVIDNMNMLIQLGVGTATD